MPDHDDERGQPVENKVPDLLEALQESFEDAKRRRQPMPDLDDFGPPGRALPPYGAPPPSPWPLAPDPRTDACRHDWTRQWGQPGERQRRCNHCRRYIWEREIWPSDGRDCDPAGRDDVSSSFEDYVRALDEVDRLRERLAEAIELLRHPNEHDIAVFLQAPLLGGTEAPDGR